MMGKTMKPKGFAKLWREIKKIKSPFRGKTQIFEQRKKLMLLKAKINEFDGEFSKVGKAIDSMLWYWWCRIFSGNSFLQCLGIHKPNFNTLIFLFAQYVGMDVEKEIQSTDEAWIFDGIKLPYPRNENDVNKKILKHDFVGIIFPSYFRRNFKDFDRFCSVTENYTTRNLYEYENVCLKEGDVVFDCGANLGVFSAVASRYGCHVFAFEAIPDIIDDYLSKTAKMNGNINVFNYAIWDKEETLEFSYILENIVGSRCNQFLTNEHFQQSRKEIRVPAITLDVFVERNNIDRVDFIKADIEGAERNMLRGATRILKEFAPKLSICTYHLPDDPQVIRELILKANPKYQIIETSDKMYAWV